LRTGIIDGGTYGDEPAPASKKRLRKTRQLILLTKMPASKEQPRKTRQPTLLTKTAKALTYLRPTGKLRGETDEELAVLLPKECRISASPATIKRARAIAWPHLKKA
jgi:hypothetical protein